jgi:hypothetical protein
MDTKALRAVKTHGCGGNSAFAWSDSGMTNDDGDVSLIGRADP